MQACFAVLCLELWSTFAQQSALGSLAWRGGWSVKASQGEGPLASLDVTHGKRVTKLLFLVHQRHHLSSKVTDLLPFELASKMQGSETIPFPPLPRSNLTVNSFTWLLMKMDK